MVMKEIVPDYLVLLERGKARIFPIKQFNCIASYIFSTKTISS